MNVPYTAIHFATYESAKKLMHEGQSQEEGLPIQVGSTACMHVGAKALRGANIAGNEPVLRCVQLGAGGLAGGLAAAATTPFDVVKTRLQLEGIGNATKYQSISVVS